jgi:hypothetical protein
MRSRSTLWDLVNPEGELYQRAFSDGWWRPATIVLKKDHVAWYGRRERDARPGPDLLEAFIRLGDEPDAKIVAYAERWGVLGIATRIPPVRPGPIGGPGRDAVGRGPALVAQYLNAIWMPLPPAGSEPVVAWRHFANQARALLETAGDVWGGASGKPENLAMLLRPLPSEWFPALAGSRSGLIRQQARALQGVSAQRRLIASVVNRWLQIGDVGLGFGWGRSAPAVRVATPCLFGALALHLLLTIARTNGFSFCSACGRPYLPSREPRAGRHYCRACGTRAAGRDAARDYRHRVAEGQVVSHGVRL